MNATNSSKSSTEIDAKAPSPTSGTRHAREDLKSLFKRYYGLLGFSVHDREGLVEIFEPGAAAPAFLYVFDRKNHLIHPEAIFVTFNSPQLESIIDSIKKKGRIAKAYIPFEFKPEIAFQDGLKKLVAKSRSRGGFVKNGVIQLKNYYIGYVPFLMFVIRMNFSSIDRSTVIEHSIIPLIDPDKETELVKERIDFYVNRLNTYFESEEPRLTNEMPVQGELLQPSDDKIMELVDTTTPRLLDSIKVQMAQVEERLQSRLQKELAILANYYEQLINETKTALDIAMEKKDKNKISDLNQQIVAIEKEQDFKKTEFASLYRLDTNYEVIGAAAIYVPIFFQFNCKITTHKSETDYVLDYNVFDHELIPPKCTCGKTIYQGQVCDNNHFSCIECTGKCHTCGKAICSACNPKVCKDCGSLLCPDDYIECAYSKNNDIEYLCKDTAIQCVICGKKYCNEHAASCVVCNRVTCLDCGLKTCKVCKAPMCEDHALECHVCKENEKDDQWICTNHRIICDFCGMNACLDDVIKCSECGKISCKTCGAYTCKYCGKYLCEDHALACAHCAEIGENPYICKYHAQECDFCDRTFCKCTNVSEVVPCGVCGKFTCSDCSHARCKKCGKVLCKDDAHECEQCKKKKRKTINICKDHLSTCAFCGKELCPDCANTCTSCSRTFCADCGIYKCKECKKLICPDHAVECDRCKREGRKNPWVCNTHSITCDICGKKFCTICEPSIATCHVCGKKICKDCKPHVCKDCHHYECDEHHHECEICKEMGKPNFDVCIHHAFACSTCGKISCSEHSMTCSVCNKRFCNNKFTNDIFDVPHCSVVVQSRNLSVCIEHSFISSLDGLLYSITDRVICDSCHLSYEYEQVMPKTIVGIKRCYSCLTTNVKNFAAFLQNAEYIFKYPSFLNMAGSDEKSSVKIKRTSYTMPKNQASIRMAENHTHYIIKFDTENDNYTLVHEKTTENEHLYRRPRFLGKIKELLTKRTDPVEIALNEPMLIRKGEIIPSKQESIIATSEIHVLKDDASYEVTAPFPLAESQSIERDETYINTLMEDVKDLFASSTRINLDLLRSKLNMDQQDFAKFILDKATDNGLVIEDDQVVVGKSDNSRFFKTLEAILHETRDLET